MQLTRSLGITPATLSTTLPPVLNSLSTQTPKTLRLQPLLTEKTARVPLTILPREHRPDWRSASLGGLGHRPVIHQTLPLSMSAANWNVLGFPSIQTRSYATDTENIANKESEESEKSKSNTNYRLKRLLELLASFGIGSGVTGGVIALYIFVTVWEKQPTEFAEKAFGTLLGTRGKDPEAQANKLIRELQIFKDYLTGLDLSPEACIKKLVEEKALQLQRNYVEENEKEMQKKTLEFQKELDKKGEKIATSHKVEVNP